MIDIANPHEVVECKKAHGGKIMAWVGFVDGSFLPVVCFNGSVNGDTYLNQALKGTVWPAVRTIATKRQYWFQQDGASCHVTTCLNFLKEKFSLKEKCRDRLISRKRIIIGHLNHRIYLDQTLVSGIM